MGKRRLTSRQIAQQKAIQAQRLKRADLQQDLNPDTLNQSLSPEQPGLLIAHYGTTLIVENQAGKLFQCGLRQNLGTLVTGDEIIWQQIDETTGVVVACLPRRSVITRPDRHTTKPIVANVDRMVIVSALEPLPQQTTLDRYLVLAEILNLPALIVINKGDLPVKAQHEFLRHRLEVYQRIDYPSVEVSSKTRMGIPALEELLQNHTSIFVGQSGVGKSSLLNCLVPNAKAQIRELSKIQRLGRHTTTASRLYHLPNGGNLIDSPGIHQFNLHHFTKEQIANGFKEFLPFLGCCKFRNCEHKTEPGCALLAAVNEGKIDSLRLQNYHALISDLS